MRSLFHYFCSTLAMLGVGILISSDGYLKAQTRPTNTVDAPPAEGQTTNAVRRIMLPHFEPNLPVAPGRDEFMRTCVACHSARYVTMQPPFSRQQWGETVRKMMNSYGAPADEFQAGKIVDYLYAIDGDGSRPPTQAPAADDDEIGATANVAVPEATETVPVFEHPVSGQDRTSDVSRGAAVFLDDCAGCHGDHGRDDGKAGQALLPKPADLAVMRFSREFLRQTLWNGVRGTSMPSWRSLPLRDLSAVTAYLQSSHPISDSSTVASESLDGGKALYEKNCLPCHGSTGDGKGPAGAMLAPPPSNFKRIQPDPDYVERVLRDGIPGTSMPVWKDQLSEPDRAAVARYVRSLYDSPE